MRDCKAVLYPSPTDDKSSTSRTATSDEHNTYRRLIGALIYLSVLTRPDESTSAGCILPPALLERNNCLGIAFTAQPRPLTLLGISYNNFTTPTSSRKTVSGYTFSLGSGTISYRSKLQSVVAESTAATEYVALGLTIVEAL